MFVWARTIWLWAARFYDAALAPPGIRNLGAFLDQGIGYGHQLAELLILQPLERGPVAPANGGTNAGKPGPLGAVPHAYGAYLRDPVGNKICAYCFDPER